MGVFQNNLMGAAAAAASAGGDFYSHQIANSCRFIGASGNDGTNYMYHTRGTPTNADKCTISAWVKRSKLGSKDLMFTGSGIYGYDYSWYGFNTANEFYAFQDNNGTQGPRLESNALFRDTSAWYHVVIAQDSTQGTASNRNKVYINGVQYTDWGDYETYSPSNADLMINSSGRKLFVGSGGASEGNSYLPYDGYIAEYVFIDGTQYAATDFGESKNGVWIPKDPSGLTFGNNGCYLKFESSGDLGNDSSGNNNDFTISNVSAHDQMLDSPTFNSDSNGGNFATWNPLRVNQQTQTFAEGNTQFSSTQTSTNPAVTGTLGATSGKWYWEIRIVAQGNTSNSVGVCRTSAGLEADTEALWAATGDVVFMYLAGGSKRTNGTTSSYGNSWTTGDILQVAMDIDNGAVYFGKNNTWQNSGNPTSGASKTGAAFTNLADKGHLQPYSLVYNNGDQVVNFGPNGTFNGAITAGGNSDDTGYGNFKYDVPAGFLAMCTGNLSTADAVDPAQTNDNYPQKLFNPVLYTGDGGSSTAITGVGFQPDWVWIKRRNAAENHNLYDSTRGVNKRIKSNSSGTETTEGLPAFGSDGFTVDASGSINNVSSQTYVSWNWRANAGTTSTNTQGSEDSTVQVDPSGGFSIVTYTGTESAATIGHGLSSAPQCILVKCRDFDRNWAGLFVNGVGNTKSLILNSNGAPDTSSGYWNNTDPTSTVFSIGGGTETNKSGKLFVAYCFANVEGYCKVGKYSANTESSDNAFVYTGFRPALLLVKATGSGHWQLIDNKRNGFNPQPESLDADRSNASRTNAAQFADLLSNGFKVRTDNQVLGEAAQNPYVYLAFAENPFKYATAR